MSVGSYQVSHRPPALAHRMAQWSGARPNWRAAGGSNRGSGIRFFRTASPHTPYISAFLGRPPRPQAPNLSIFWTGLPAGTPKIYPHRWTAFVRIFRGPIARRRSSDSEPGPSVPRIIGRHHGTRRCRIRKFLCCSPRPSSPANYQPPFRVLAPWKMLNGQDVYSKRT